MTEPLARVAITTPSPDRVDVTLSGEVDLSNAADVHAQIVSASAAAQVMTIDLRAVTYLDSQGVRVLAQLARAASADRRRLVVVAPADSIAGGILHITRLTDHVTVLEAAPSEL